MEAGSIAGCRRAVKQALKQVAIEVVTPAGRPADDKGRLVEKLAARLLQTQNYRVVERLRITGAEVDLLAQDKTTEEKVLVECKGARDAVPSSVIRQLIGTVFVKQYDAGWLIATSDLTKDGKGLWHEWHDRPPSERRKLHIYTPASLVERLETAGVLFPFQRLSTPDDVLLSEECHLIVAPNGLFWALPVLDASTRLRKAVLLYDAASGERLTDRQLLQSVAETDTTLADLEWLGQRDHPRDVHDLHDELQSVVRVPQGESWADYRPARPEDFVGRDETQHDVLSFFDRVRQRATTTRILAICAPSGWGKSSIILKIAARASTRKIRKKLMVVGVDCRAASTKRYPELALLSALNEAKERGFLPSSLEPTLGDAADPLKGKVGEKLCSYLASTGKVFCLVFDQFEELLYKEELVAVFEGIRRLCFAVDEMQENIVIGFSWKSDSTVPSDHKAYFLWHELSDRRKQFDLAPFSAADVSKILSRFSSELGYPLSFQLRRVLRDNCQGYPWLLKKLCIHILHLARNGLDQNEILDRSLSIEELFRRDMSDLSSKSVNCLREIARESPADYFRMTEFHGNEVVKDLIDRRLVIRSGTRLTLYWDIFRDFVLTDKSPNIPISYVPQANLGKHLQGLRILIQRKKVAFKDLGDELGLTHGSVDNLVRDFVNIGNAEAQRSAEIVTLVSQDEASAAATVFDFLRSHVVYRKLVHEIGLNVPFDVEVVIRFMHEIYAGAEFAERTWHTVARKMLRWLVAFDLATRDESAYLLKEGSPSPNLPLPSAVGRRGVRDRFLGDAPPEGVVRVAKASAQGAIRRAELEQRFGRNAVAAAMRLGVVRPADKPESLTCATADGAEATELVRRSAAQTSTVAFVLDLLRKNPMIPGDVVGEQLAQAFSYRWSPGSTQRTGNALSRWARWVQAPDQPDLL